MLQSQGQARSVRWSSTRILHGPYLLPSVADRDQQRSAANLGGDNAVIAHTQRAARVRRAVPSPTEFITSARRARGLSLRSNTRKQEEELPMAEIFVDVCFFFWSKLRRKEDWREDRGDLKNYASLS